MAYQGITTSPVGSSDSLLQGGVKINSNFTEIYSAIGDGSTINLNQKVGFTTVVTIPQNDQRAPLADENNGLFILEGPNSGLVLQELDPIGTKYSIISKNSTNELRPSSTVSVMGQADGEFLVIDRDYASFDLVYTGPTFGWAIQ